MAHGKHIRLLLLGLGTLVLVSGCDWWSSSSKNTSGSKTDSGVKTVQLAGYVEDPAIRGARVELWNGGGVVKICGAAGDQLCRTVSGDEGSFRFNAKADALSGLKLVAVGGTDVETGSVLGDLSLQSLLDAVASRTGLAVTPVTTLVGLAVEGGKSLDAARTEVRRFLDLPEGTDLFLRPMGPGGERILRRSMVITKILTDLAAEGTADPLGLLAAQLKNGRRLMENGSLVESTLEQTGLSEVRRKEALSLHGFLDKSTAQDAAGLVREARKALLADTLMTSMERLLGTADADFDSHRDRYFENASVLAENLLAHSTMPVKGLAVERVFRYLLAAYGLVQMELNTEKTAYVVSGRLVEGLLQPADLKRLEDGVDLSRDTRIGELAKAAYVYDVAEALLPAELPGNDNAKRVAYYHRSNASRLHKAETMLDTVLDDGVNDAIRAEIVRGKAQVGLFDEARAIIREQMYLDNHKAEAWIGMAKGYAPFGKNTEAAEALEQAFALQKNLLTLKGTEGVDNEDTSRLQLIASIFRKMGMLNRAGEVMDYMARDVLPGLVGSSHFGRLVVSLRNQADVYLAYGEEDTSKQDLVRARETLETLHQYSSLQPAKDSKGKKTYKPRVYALAETALRFAALGERIRVEAIVEEIEALRADDGLISYPDTNPQRLNVTGTETWVYVPYMVEALAEVGSEEKATALTGTIPETEATYLGSSYAALVSTLARQGKTDELLELVDTRVLGVKPERFPDTTMAMRIETLTYVNSINPRAGIILAEAGHLAAAEKVGDHALRYANAVYNSGATEKNISVQKVKHGYTRVARIFHLAGAAAKAQDALERAETVIFGGTLDVEMGDGRGGLLKDASGNFIRENRNFSGLSDDEHKLYAMGWTARMWKEIGNPERAMGLLEKGREHLEAIAGVRERAFVAAEYNKLAQAALECGEKGFALTLTGKGWMLAGEIHTDATPEGERENSLKAEAAQLRAFGVKAYQTGDGVLSRTLLAKALTASRLLSSIANQVSEMEDIAEAAGSAGLTELALEAALTIPLIPDRYKTLGEVAGNVVNRDDFKGVSIAWVDTDKDGKPDFFHPLATAEQIAASGLALDTDCDGDGISDTTDLRPLYRD